MTGMPGAYARAMTNLVDRVWADPMWRECFRLARGSTMRAVLGFTTEPGRQDFDAFTIDEAVAVSAGVCFGEPFLGVFRLDKDGDIYRPSYILVTGQCECTIGNGSDRWDEECSVDVQIAGGLEDIVLLAMGVEERQRLGYPAV